MTFDAWVAAVKPSADTADGEPAAKRLADRRGWVRYQFRQGARRTVISVPIAVRAMKRALARRVTTPAEIADIAIAANVWARLQPSLEALTIDA